MDAHHPKVERKGFKEYFLEFLMIFLAVTMGFFAESFREHVTEKTREREYMKEIVENLKYDTLRCNLNMGKNATIEQGLDSLRNELKEAIRGKINANALYYFTLKYTGNVSHAIFNTSAITELKNSGSLRLIENKKLVTEVSDYYERKIAATQNYLPNSQELTDLHLTDFFSLVDLDDYIQSYDHIQATTYSNNYDYRNLLKHEPALRLLKSDAASLEKFYTDLGGIEIKIKYYHFWLGYCKEAAEKLIIDVQKEYHLENK